MLKVNATATEAAQRPPSHDRQLLDLSPLPVVTATHVMRLARSGVESCGNLGADANVRAARRSEKKNTGDKAATLTVGYPANTSPSPDSL